MPQAEANRNMLLPQDIAGCSAIKRQGLTGLHQLMRTNPKSNRIRIERHTGATSCRNDPPPVRIAAVDCGLHQGGATNRARHLQRRGLVNRTLHLHLDQTRRPFSIPSNGLGQLLHRLGEALFQHGMVLLGQPVGLPRRPAQCRWCWCLHQQ